MTSFPREIHGAPPESLIVKVAEVIGSFKTVRKMALFWCRVVAEVSSLYKIDLFNSLWMSTLNIIACSSCFFFKDLWPFINWKGWSICLVSTWVN